ncbi:hypothetical protein NA56DRAFT_747975 [Hyaloscypha hepaticicola]|uniref:Uncharacterized protein n=1 Tax=Hyaloscypha hepaticicola TaxID=2082293 RepID=A0A2J6Q7D2_9HELO|nr:hypothetical protein NA56DRAFT_747975 [Hyaloscypha hepaticicola]
MPLVGRSQKSNSNSYFESRRRDDEIICVDDINDDCKEEGVNQRISVIVFTIPRKSHTLQTQTFPSVTIPTALTSSTFRSTEYLGPTPALSIPSTISLTIISAYSIRFSTLITLPTPLTLPTTRSLSPLSISANCPSSTQNSQFFSSSASTLTFTSKPASTAVAEASASTAKPRLSAGTIAGITMAAFVLSLVPALLLFFGYKRFRSRKRGSSGANSLYEKQLFSPIRSPYEGRRVGIAGMDIQLAKNQPNAPFSESPGASWMKDDRRRIPATTRKFGLAKYHYEALASTPWASWHAVTPELRMPLSRGSLPLG